MRPLVLINANVSRPPVGPVGLEYVGHSVAGAGMPVEVIDLVFENDWRKVLVRRFSGSEPLAVGISVRNTDDCCFATRESFLPWVNQLVQEVKRLTAVPVVLGGVGFSIEPEVVLKLTGVDFGIAGDGEETMPLLMERLIEDADVLDLPNLVHWHEEDVVCNPRAEVSLERLPLPRRQLFDNPRYEREGAMVGIETKRGCTGKCVYCADPVAKGRRIRTRPPQVVADEMRGLVEQGVSWFHLCDSEFNLPLKHAKDVCTALVQEKLGGKVRWYCYCSPVPFDDELAGLMVRAGCAGINFGVDSLCDGQLARLARNHRLDDVRGLVSILKKNKLNFMFDLLVGGLGETEATIRTTVEQVRELEIPLTGMAVGVRVYRHTPLWQLITEGVIAEGLHPVDARDFSDPVFYLSPSLGSEPSGLLRELIRDDPRFMLLVSPDEEESYNYINAHALYEAIEHGARGAYWDILRKTRGVV